MRKLAISVVVSVAILGMAGCEYGEQGREVTGYREIDLTVASEKVPGVIGGGNNSLAIMYAVKTDGSLEWTPMSSIGGFEYEEGKEYRIRISETDYLDYRMGTPSWTERELLEIISGTEKESEGVPDHFIPEWFLEGHFVPKYRYASEAVDRTDVDEYLKGRNPFPADGRLLVYGAGMSKWLLLDAYGNTAAKGAVSIKNKDNADFPQSYRILPPEGGQIYGYMEWTFLDEKEETEVWPAFDVIIARASCVTGESDVMSWTPYLYLDLTEECEKSFPDAGVTAAVLYLEIELPVRIMMP